MLFLALPYSFAQGQWKKIYETDYSNYQPDIRNPITGLVFFGSDSGIIVLNKSIIFGKDTIPVLVTSYTIDGGKNWHDRLATTYPYGRGIAAFNINNIWLNNAPFIYHSTDGGFNWETDSVRDSLGYTIRSLYFLDSLNGVAGGGGMTMFRTSDGGKNWQRVHDPETDAAHYPIYYIAFSSTKDGIATTLDVGTWVLRTNDGGFSWKFTTDIFTAVANRSYGLSYPDPRNAFLCDRNAIHHSTDSGMTWHQVGVLQPLGGYLRSIAFADSLHGIAEAITKYNQTDTMIFGYTSDGGISWRKVIIDSGGGSIGFTSFPDTNVAYAAGINAVYKLNIKELFVVSSQFINDFNLSLDGDHITITIPSGFPGSVRIVDLLGHMIEQRSIGIDNKTQISLRGMPRQLFIEVRSQNQFKVFKVLH